MSLRLKFDIRSFREVPDCPHAKATGIIDDAHDKIYDGPDFCELSGKMCLLESGDTCSEYEEYLQEQFREDVLMLLLCGKDFSYCCRRTCENNYLGRCYIRPEFTEVEDSDIPEVLWCENYKKKV